MLDVQCLNLAYGDLRVLWDVDLQVAEGEIVAVIGSNGAGKSSLLRSLSRLVTSTATGLRFLNTDLNSLSSHEVVALGIIHVPEGRRIFGELTVMENLRMGSYVPSARETRARNLERVFELFPRLLERKAQLGGTMSGGEQQMLAIARGLMANPRLLLLDEPTLGLSPMLARQILHTISEIHRQGTSVLLVEQNVYQSLAICNRAYVLENGRVTLTGSGKELLHNEHVKAAYLGLPDGNDPRSIRRPTRRAPNAPDRADIAAAPATSAAVT